jgi:hypothetical protein
MAQLLERNNQHLLVCEWHTKGKKIPPAAGNPKHPVRPAGQNQKQAHPAPKPGLARQTKTKPGARTQYQPSGLLAGTG